MPSNKEQPRGSRPAKALIAITALALALSGCSTMVAYTPKANEPLQTLKYPRGVGTVAEKNESHEIFMYPTFRTQGTTMPTLTDGLRQQRPTQHASMAGKD